MAKAGAYPRLHLSPGLRDSVADARKRALAAIRATRCAYRPWQTTPQVAATVTVPRIMGGGLQNKGKVIGWVDWLTTRNAMHWPGVVGTALVDPCGGGNSGGGGRTPGTNPRCRHTLAIWAGDRTPQLNFAIAAACAAWRAASLADACPHRSSLAVADALGLCDTHCGAFCACVVVTQSKAPSSPSTAILALTMASP